MLDRGNGGQAPDQAVLRAILHAVAASACRVAAKEDRPRRAHWQALAYDQSKKSGARLHQAASAVSLDAADAASSSSEA